MARREKRELIKELVDELVWGTPYTSESGLANHIKLGLASATRDALENVLFLIRFPGKPGRREKDES